MPHISNELWSISNLTNKELNLMWPKFNKKIIQMEEIEIAIQINGKTRGSIVLINEDENEEELVSRISNLKSFNKFLENKKIVKKIYVKKRLINLIIK